MPISDLTGTKWVINDSPTITSGYGTFSLTFSGEYEDMTGLAIGYNKRNYTTGGDLVAGNNLFFLGDIGGSYSVEGALLSITGGTDATNATLISWLEANATQQGGSQLTVDMSTLTGWDALSSGSHTVQIVAKATGYRDSEPTVAVSFTKAPSGYNVRVQGVIDYTGSVTIYDGMTPNDLKLVDYENKSSFTFDETVLCTSGYLDVDARGCQPCYNGNGSGGVAKTGDYFTVTGDGSITGIYAYGCFVEGTEITLVDGSTKKIEDITFDDDLLVYDFYEGKFSTAKPQWISEAKTMDNYLRVSFDNGSELKVIGPGGDIGYHRIFNVEAQSFTHTGTQECQVGTTAFTDKGELTKIVSQEVVKEDVRFFNVITDKHYNLFANGILTSCKLSNRYEIKDMKYTDKELMTEQEVNEYIDTLPYKGFKTEETQKG